MSKNNVANEEFISRSSSSSFSTTFIEKFLFNVSGKKNDSTDTSITNNKKTFTNSSGKHIESLDVTDEIEYLYSLLQAISDGDTQAYELRNEIQNIIESDDSIALTTLTQLSTNYVMTSESEEIIDNFLMAIASLSPSKAKSKSLYRIIVTSFLSSQSHAACKGALVIFDKFGNGDIDYKLLKGIRDFNIPGLDDYKRKVLERLERSVL